MANFAKVAGIGKSTLIRYEAGERLPDLDGLYRLALAGNVTVAWLATGNDGSFSPAAGASDSADDFVMVPRYDVHGSAGNGELIHSEQIVDHLAFRAEWVRNALGVARKDLALISVKGDSMEPTLANGDLILVDTSARHVEDSAIYVLNTPKGLFVKRLQHKLSGEVIVKSDNADKYEQEVYGPEAAAQLSVVGRVVWAGRRL